MSKRLSALLVLGLVVLALAACGGSAPESASSTEQAETVATETVVSEAATETETEAATETAETEEAETEEAETAAATDTGGSAPAGSVSFANDVWPIFQANCSGCHGNSGGLNLASYDTLMAGGRRGPEIVPGDAGASRLVQYVQSGRMPPNGRLSDAEIQMIVDWVNAGAPNN
ncbi:MAG: c-type cytochrome domain-containing protein [Anaerolineales bacterium]